MKNNMNWGKGIPSYSRYDLLDRREERGICMAAAVKYLEEQGAEITSICEKPVPHIRTELAGEKAFFLVVSSAGRKLGRYSFAATREFTLLTKGRDAKAKVLFVGICPKDEERCVARLLLKGDDLETQILDVQDLANDSEPSFGDEGYQSYWVEQIALAYKDGSFHRFTGILAEDFELGAPWMQEPIRGREEALKFLY